VVGFRLQTAVSSAAGPVRTSRRRRVELWWWRGLRWPDTSAVSSRAGAGVRPSSDSALQRAKRAARGTYGVYAVRQRRRWHARDQKVTVATPATSARGGGFGLAWSSRYGHAGAERGHGEERRLTLRHARKAVEEFSSCSARCRRSCAGDAEEGGGVARPFPWLPAATLGRGRSSRRGRSCWTRRLSLSTPVATTAKLEQRRRRSVAVGERRASAREEGEGRREDRGGARGEGRGALILSHLPSSRWRPETARARADQGGDDTGREQVREGGPGRLGFALGAR
jgi:hypothetical protein